MAEYHVGAGLFGIYAGTLDKNGIKWRNKSEVTREALSAAAQYLLEQEKEYRFIRASDGKAFVMRIVEREVID